MNKEVMQQAIKVLKDLFDRPMWKHPKMEKAIQDLEEALKQEKEYEVVDGVGQGVEIPRGWKYYYIKPKIPLQTKEWAGLTDEEYFQLQMKIKTPMISVQDYIDAMRMVEAKLKEKNGY